MRISLCRKIKKFPEFTKVASVSFYCLLKFSHFILSKEGFGLVLLSSPFKTLALVQDRTIHVQENAGNKIAVILKLLSYFTCTHIQ